jgi:HEAT repeat protein
MALRGPLLCLAAAAFGSIAGCAGGGAPLLNGADGPQSDQEKRLEELQRQVAAQAVEIVRLQLALARAEKDEKRRKEILRTQLGSALPEVRSFVLRELAAEPAESAAEFIDLGRAALAGDSAPAVRIRALQFLARFPQCEEIVLAGAADRTPEVRAAAAGALKAYDSERSFETQRSLMLDPDRGVRVAAIDALAHSKNPRAGAEILAVLRAGPEDGVLERGLRALATLKTTEAGELFVAHLSHKVEAVQWACVQGLGALGDPAAAGHVRPFLSADQSRALREITIQTLGRLKDARSVADLVKIAQADPEETLRTAACSALGQIGDESAVELLLQVFALDTAAPVRARAWDALQVICSKEFARQERLVRRLIGMRRKAEADEVFTRMAQYHNGGENGDRLRGLELELARFLMEEKEFHRALARLKAISGVDGDLALVRDLGICYRQVGDHATSLKTLRDAIAKLKPTDAMHGELFIEVVRTLSSQKDPAAALEEIARAAAGHGSALSDAARRALREEAASNARALVAELRNADEAARARASKALRTHGRFAMPAVVAAAREEAARDLRPAIVEIGNAVAGTRIDPKAAEKDEEFAAALEAWTEWTRRNPW